MRDKEFDEAEEQFEAYIDTEFKSPECAAYMDKDCTTCCYIEDKFSGTKDLSCLDWAR